MSVEYGFSNFKVFPVVESEVISIHHIAWVSVVRRGGMKDRRMWTTLEMMLMLFFFAF